MFGSCVPVCAGVCCTNKIAQILLLYYYIRELKRSDMDKDTAHTVCGISGSTVQCRCFFSSSSPTCVFYMPGTMTIRFSLLFLIHSIFYLYFLFAFLFCAVLLSRDLYFWLLKRSHCRLGFCPFCFVLMCSSFHI